MNSRAWRRIARGDSKLTLDEYILDQFRDNVRLYRGLFVGEIAAGIAGVFLILAALVMGEFVGALGILPTVAFLFTSGLMARQVAQDYSAGLAELEQNPVGIPDRADLSLKTEKYVFRALREAKDQFSLIFAYGILALTLALASALLFAISSGEAVYVIAGSTTSAMALALIYLSVQAFLSWRAAKRLEAEIAEV